MNCDLAPVLLNSRLHLSFRSLVVRNPVSGLRAHKRELHLMMQLATTLTSMARGMRLEAPGLARRRGQRAAAEVEDFLPVVGRAALLEE